jgi:hypothetical protein
MLSQDRPIRKTINAPQAVGKISYEDLSDIKFEGDIFKW